MSFQFQPFPGCFCPTCEGLRKKALVPASISKKYLFYAEQKQIIPDFQKGFVGDIWGCTEENLNARTWLMEHLSDEGFIFVDLKLAREYFTFLGPDIPKGYVRNTKPQCQHQWRFYQPLMAPGYEFCEKCDQKKN